MTKDAPKGVKLIRADTFKYLPTMADGWVDCVVTSPPYWDIKDYSGKSDQYGNEPTLEEYRAKTRVLCRELYRVTKPKGSVWVIVGYKREKENRLVNLPALWADDTEAEGFILRQLIIWDKKGRAAPEGPANRERDTHEIVLHLVKRSDHSYATKRAPYKNAAQATAKSQHGKVYKWVARGLLTYAQGQKAHAEIDRRTKAGENNRIRGPGERPMRPNSAKGECAPDKRERDLKRDGFYFANWHEDGAVGGNVWRIGHGGVRGLDHPCAFPVELAWECIRRTCPPNGIVLDCFMGVGSTAIAAMRLSRRVIGIEIMWEHFETAKRRVKEGK